MSEWIKWKGGECPVKPGAPTWIEFRFKDRLDEPYRIFVREPETLTWRHSGSPGDIVAYKIEEQS